MIERRFDTREERDGAWQEMRLAGTRHLQRRTTSIAGKMIWILCYPVEVMDADSLSV